MATADASRTVNIAINVVGNVATKFTAISNGLKALATPLADINKDIEKAATGVDKFAKSLASITAVPDLSSFRKEITKLSTIDSGQVAAFVEATKGLKGLGVSSSFTTMVDGLQKLTSISGLPDLKTFAASVTALKKALTDMPITTLGKLGSALQSFSGATMPTGTKLTGFATALTSLSKVDTSKLDSSKLVKIASALTSFSGVGTLPSGKTFTSFATALKSLSNVTITAAKISNLESVAKLLPKFVGTTTGLPTKAKLSAFVAGMKSLASINVSGIDAGKLVSVSAAIRSFSGIGTLPNLSKFSETVSALGKISTSGIDRIIPAIQRLVTALQSLAAVTPALKVFITLSQAMGTSSSGLSKVGSALDSVGAKGKTAKTGLTEAANGINDIKNTTSGAATNVNRFATALKNLKSSVQNYTKYRLIADSIIALKEALFGGVTSIIEYDQALKDLQAITGATSLEVEQMGEKIIQVAQDTKFSASEVAAGMRTLGQAGFSAGESVQAMEAISNLATGTLSEMSATVDLVSTALRVFRLDASETARVSDVFANAVNRSKLTTDKLRISMNYVGPIARDMGLSIEEMSASMMTLANSGLRASTIGTGLRRVLAELANPSEKLTMAAKEAGIALEDLNPQTNDFSEVIRNLGIVVDDTGTAFDLFGKRGAAAVLALSSDGNAFDEMLASAQTSGTAAEMAGIQIEGLGVSIKNLKDTFGVLAISMGKGGFTSALAVVVDGLKFMVDSLIKVSDATGGFITQTFALVSALVLLAATLKATASTAFGVFLLNVGKNIGTVILGIQSLTARIYEAAAATVYFESVSGLWVISAALTALAIVLVGMPKLFKHMTTSAQEASDEASKLADVYEQNIKTIDNYNVAVSSMAEGSKERNTENLKLRTSLKLVAEGDSDLANAAWLAAASIDGLNGSMSDTSALDAYYEKAKELEALNISKSFTEGFEALQQQTGLLSNVTATFKAIGPYLGDVASTWAESLTNWDWYREPFTQLGSNILNALKKGLEGLNDNRIAVRMAEDLNEGKVSWEEFTVYVSGLMDKLDADLTAKERVLLTQFKKRTEDATAALQQMGLTGSNAANVTSTQMLITAKNMKLIEDEGGTAAQALTKEFEKVKDALSFTDIIGKWAEENKKIPEGVDQVADAYKDLGIIVSETDKIIADGLIKRKADIIAEQELLNNNRSEAYSNAGTDEERLAVARKYAAEQTKIDKDAADIRKKLSENEVIQNTQKYLQLAAKRDADYAKNKALNAKEGENNAARLAEFVKTETAITKTFNDALVRMRGESTTTAEALVAGTVANSAVEQQLKDALYAIEVAEGSGVLTHEKAEESKLKTSVDYYNKLAAQARAKLAEVESLEGSADPDELADAVAAAEDYEQELADAKLAVLAQYGEDVVDLTEDIAKEKEKAEKEEEKNTKILATAKKKYSDDEVKYRAKADKAIAKSSEKYDAAVLKSKEKMWGTLEDLAQDYKDAQLDRDLTVADNARTLEDDVNTIRRRGMDDEEKASNDRLQASKKYAAAMSLIAEVNSAANADDRAAGAEKLKLAGQLLDDSKELSANDADDGFALSGVYKVAAAKDKAAQAQLVLDKKNIDALAAEAKAKQVAEEAQAKKVRDAALKSVADILVEDLKGISTKLEAANKAEDTRHTKVMDNIAKEVAEYKRLLAEAIQGQSDAVVDINTPVATDSSATGSASTNGTGLPEGWGSPITDGAIEAKSAVDKLAASMNIVRKEGETDVELALKVSNSKEVNEAITRFKNTAEQNLKENPVQAQATLETSDAVSKVKALSKEFFTLYNESTDKDGVHTVLAEGTEGAQKLNDKLAEVSKQFEVMGTPSGDQNLQDKVNFLNAMSDAGVDATDAYKGLMKEVESIDNRSIQFDMSEGYAVIDDLGNKITGVKQDFQSNPISIGAELGVSGVDTLRALGELKGLTNSFTDTIKLKIDLKNAATQQLEAINKQIGLLDDKEIEILAELDDGEVSADIARIEEARSKLEAKATEIQIILDTTKAEEDLAKIAEAKAKLDARAEQLQIQVDVGDEAASELTKIARLKEQLDIEAAKLEVGVDDNASEKLAKIAEVKGKLEAREAQLRIILKGGVDAKAKLDDIDILTEKLDAKESEIRLNLNTQNTKANLQLVDSSIDAVHKNAEKPVELNINGDDAGDSINEAVSPVLEPIEVELEPVDTNLAAEMQDTFDDAEDQIVAEIAVQANISEVKRGLEDISGMELDSVKGSVELSGSDSKPAMEKIAEINNGLNTLGGNTPPIVLELDESAIDDLILKLGKGVQLPATVEIEIEDNNDVMDLLNLLAGDDGLSTEVSATTTSETKEDMGVLQTFINELMDNPLVFAITLQVDKALTAIKSLLKEIDKLEDKVITITTKSSGSSSSNYADGGPVFNKLTSPFITQGGGTIDDVPAMLMRGEFVFTQAAVKKYGLELLQAMNSGMLNLDKLIPKAYAGGGMVEPQNFAGGGGVGFLSSMSGFTLPSFSTGGMVNSVGASTNSTASTGSMVNIKLDLPVTGTPVSIQADRWNANELVSQLIKLKRGSA